MSLRLSSLRIILCFICLIDLSSVFTLVSFFLSFSLFSSALCIHSTLVFTFSSLLCSLVAFISSCLHPQSPTINDSTITLSIYSLLLHVLHVMIFCTECLGSKLSLDFLVSLKLDSIISFSRFMQTCTFYPFVHYIVSICFSFLLSFTYFRLFFASST